MLAVGHDGCFWAWSLVLYKMKLFLPFVGLIVWGSTFAVGQNDCSIYNWITTTTEPPSSTLGVCGQARKKVETMAERTFVMVKPDGVQRGLVGEIMKRFEQKGFKLVAAKLVRPPKTLIEKHYEEHRGKGFFNGLVTYIESSPVFAMVYEGGEVILTTRKMVGETKPFESAPGTIRGDFARQVGRNIVHASDSWESAKREIALWFTDSEICEWEDHSKDWIEEK